VSSPFCVADYLQLASLGHHSVVLDVGGAVTGRICVVDGQAWSALDTHGEGLEAFRRMALAREVLVQCQALVGDPGPRTLSGTCESLLLEVARLHDEAQARRRPAEGGFTELALEDEPARTFDELFELAVEASLAKRLADALALFRQASALEPEDLKVKVNISRLEKLLQANGAAP
jgi:hypothetical protein